jgi:hypothetical protein
LAIVDQGILDFAVRVENTMLRANKAIRGMVSEASSWLQNRFSAVINSLKGKLEEAGDWFARLRDRVTGHSYIPDMVDEIATQMDRLQPVMVDKTKKATKETADQFKALQGELSPLMDRLFPEVGDLREFRKNMQILERGRAKGQIDDATFEAGRSRLGGIEEKPFDMQVSPLEDMFKMEDFSEAFDVEILEPAREKTAEVVTAFSDMAVGVVGSIRNMVDSFKSGDILGGIQSMLDLITQVVDVLKLVGVIKGGAAIAGARALGGPVSANKSYLVGEKGPEWFTPSRSGFVHPNGSNAMPQRVQVQVVPSEYFDVVVQEQAAGVAAPMMISARNGGAAGGYQAVVNRQKRSIP